ncbi:ABC transporter G family member 20 [Folsomia candida]|uniref:ABC transporter G family member 20 n=1 Tax=Folsomia candida TaxID=158441 RepID=A0A226ENM4_FOLCA|nr:ABC transporter G family member 20 [Folsomia candida]
MKKWEMDRRKQRNGKFEEGLLDHRIPHIQMGPNLINKPVIVDTVAYSPRRPALVLKGGIKKYGTTLVLHNLNMFAKEGTIYCLVGASKTGKSTILECITGQKRLTKGELHVFGSVPGSASSGIPGRRVGYMPQELGLHVDLSITEVLEYHGRMVGMNLEQIGERIDKLSELLDLQHLKTPLRSLRIWMHLLKLVSNGRTSVILTTQNLEEARQAHRVGILRNGRLLVEDSPSSLLHRHNTQLIAEAVAKLSIKDTIRLKKEGDKKNKDEIVCMDEWNSSFGIQSYLEESKDSSGVISAVSYKEWMEQVGNKDEDQFKLGQQGKDTKSQKTAFKKMKDENIPRYRNPSKIGDRLSALFFKQLIQCIRNPWAFVASLLLPLIIVVGFCHSIGRTGPLHNVNVGVVNMDAEEQNFTFLGCTYVAGCSNKMLTCRFLDTLAGQDAFNFLDFDTEEEAIQEMKQRKISALLKFENGFGSEVYQKVASSGDDNNDAFNSTRFKFVHDKLNDIFLRQFISNKVATAMTTLEQELGKDCFQESQKLLNDEEDETSTDSIADAERLISSGNETTNVRQISSPGYPEFYIPAGMILVAFFTPLFASGGFQFLQERKDGVLNRAFVSGASSWESLVTHLLFQLPSLLVTTAVLILVPIFLFGIKVNLCLIWEVGLLLVLANFMGISLNFLLCTIYSKFHNVSLTGICFFVASLILSGLLWPIESQHWVLQWGSHYLPWTLPTKSLKSIIIRDADLLDLNSGVWQGFAVLAAWTGFIWLLLVLVLAIRYLKR